MAKILWTIDLQNFWYDCRIQLLSFILIYNLASANLLVAADSFYKATYI